MVDEAPVVYGKYQLLDRLARGGMAEVFKAKSHGVEGFEKILVIKRILPELSENPSFVEMFINEAKIAVTLSHANIVQVFDLGRADDTYFIAMEYVAGYDLATILRRARRYDKPLPPELSVYIVSEVAKGLDYAHRRRDAHLRPLNIVHRDVSPQNVLLSYEGEVKLTDFGIAKARTTVERDADGALKGKYAYMAPEQAHQREVDPRTDLFALGTVLYEALAQKNPFATESSYDTLQNVKLGLCPPLSEVTDLPAELSLIVQKAMSVNPDDRHPNAGRLYEDLIQFLYASGRRVGAHDLSRYLDELRDASEGRATDDAQIRASFDADALGVHQGADATPIEVPSGRSTPSRRPSTGPGTRVRRKSGLSQQLAERRDVTVLALLVGPHDPLPESTVHSLIRRFGGTVLEQSHEGERWVVVAFGISDPDGREGEAAARCGLRIARAAAAAAEQATQTTARLGLHAGRLLLDMAGGVIRDEVFDALVDKAKRTAGRAPRGYVLGTKGCERPLRSRFRLDPTGDGEGDEATFLVAGERGIAEAFGKFVGRRNELRRIGELLAFAAKGRRRIIGLVGEPGTGKTRLLLETSRRLRLGGHDVGVYLATIARQSRDVPLAACQEMLRVVLGIDELDPEPVIRDKIGRLRELGLTTPEARAVEATLGIQGTTENTAQLGGRPLRAALARIATSLAQDRLTVFAFDGIESIDDESLALLDGLLRDARHARIAMVAAYRPGFQHRWGELPGYHEIEIGPLPDEDIVQLTGSRLGAEEVPLSLLRDVTTKSGGNPLYVEEYLKALVDAGAVEVRDGQVTYKPEVAADEVPKTLRGIVAARVARLDPVHRQILQVAAVAGVRFGSELLARVAEEDGPTVGRALAVLSRRGIVQQSGPGEFRFAHDLVAEVLRDGLTVEALRGLHGAVAAALEELYPQRVDELAEQLAEHFRQAGERGRAIDYLVRAADRLESEQALDGAVESILRAISMLGQTPTPDRDRVLSLYRRVGELCYRSRNLEFGAEKMAAALELAEDLGRDEYVARFSMMRGRLLVNAHYFQEGRKWLDRARTVARQLGNRELLRDITLASAEADTRNGEYARAVVLLEEALSLSRDTGHLQAQIHCLIPLSLAHGATGDSEKARATLSEARRLAGIHPDRYTDCELLKTEALVHYYARNHQGVVDASQRALELAKEYGFVHEAAINAHNLGEGLLRLGDYKRAFSSLRYSYEIARQHGMHNVEYINLRVLGFIDAVRFGSSEGRQRIADALRYAEEHNYVWDIIQSRFFLAIADHALGHLDEARRGLQETLRLSAEHGDVRYHEDAERALRSLDAGQPVELPA